MNAKELTAAQTREARITEINKLIGMLAYAANKCAQEGATQPKDWSYVGSLGKVRDDLINTVAFITSRDADDVARSL